MEEREKLIKILTILKEDFEMLYDGRWDMAYTDKSEVLASLENVDEAIELAKKIK